MISAAMMLPMPVIVGVPRSGTTLLRMMVDAHPAVAIPPETGFLPSLAELGSGADSWLRAWEVITGFHTWPDFHLDSAVLWEALADLSPASPAAVVRTFYRLYAERFGKARWGDKTPAYGAELTRIASLLPEARFIHLIRDGRDVALSVRGLWFRPGDSLEACAADWARRLAHTRTLGAQTAHYLEVRYEALVQFPERTLREVCRFLELGFEPRMLDYHLRAPTRLDEHQALHAADGRVIISKRDRLHNQRLVMTPPQASRIERWTSEMSADEVRGCEAVAGEWLERLGYPVGSRAVC